MIEVKQTGGPDPLTFDVTISEGGSETQHQVTISHSDIERLTNGAVPPDECIAAAFRFLLDREPKEAILPHFDISMISRYFPEFEARLPGYLASASDGNTVA